MTRSYGGRTAEQRRLDRRATLLDAALDLLDGDGVEAVTLRGVCARARLNDRYFHEHFAGRDALLVAVLDDMAMTAAARIMNAIVGLQAGVATVVGVAMRECLAHLREDPRRGRVLAVSQATDSLRARRQEIVRTLAELMVQQRERLLPGSVHRPDAELVAVALVSGIVELLAMWWRGELAHDDEQFARFLARLILANVDVTAVNGVAG